MSKMSAKVIIHSVSSYDKSSSTFWNCFLTLFDKNIKRITLLTSYSCLTFRCERRSKHREGSLAVILPIYIVKAPEPYILSGIWIIIWQVTTAEEKSYSGLRWANVCEGQQIRSIELDVQSSRSARAGRDDVLNRTQMYTVRIAALSLFVAV